MENQTYNNLLKIKSSCRIDYFCMVCSYFFDIGYQGAKSISDKDIENVQANGMFSKDFNEWLMKTAKEIADTISSAIELVQFCMAEDIFDIRLFANKLPRNSLEDMVKTRISWEDQIRTDNADYIRYLVSRYDCDAEDLELLNITVPDEYYENAM